jgi:hypothetical protein
MNNTNYKIASVYLPKKNYTLENAKSFLKHHGYKINKVDDENNYFKFRQLTPQTLRKYGYVDYKTKQLGKSGILLIIAYKDLDDEEDIRGGDFINYIGDRYNQAKDFLINGSRSFSRKVKNILAKVGNDRIYTITIFRYPINSMIKNILELTSLQSIPYDNLFHLGLIFNNQVLLEKNSIINMEINPRLPKDTEFVNMSFNQLISINQFINNTLNFMGQDKFFTYSAYDNNCQYFALNLLYANGINDDSLISFVKQNTEDIFRNNPYLRRFSNNITDVHGRLTSLNGGKMKRSVRFH